MYLHVRLTLSKKSKKKNLLFNKDSFVKIELLN